MNQTVDKKQVRPKLWTLNYNDSANSVRLETYADTLVYDDEGIKSTLVAVRFGGYPEQVNGMADAIYAGGEITAKAAGCDLWIKCLTKQYKRKVANNDIYTEATLLVEDDRIEVSDNKDENGKQQQNKKNNGKQQKKEDTGLYTNYIFCAHDNMEQLFAEIDRKVSVPLIPEFADYVISELLERNILKKLTVLSLREKFDAWKIMLSVDNQNIVSVIEDGLKSGVISIPGSSDGTPFEDIHSVSSYLNTFGVMIAEKIKGQFNPLFDPSAETLSKEVLDINANIRKQAGYPLYDAQLAVSEALKRRLDKSKFALCVAECGSGKSKIGATALCAHQYGKGKMKTFNIILCPSHLSKKWIREIEETLPNTFAVHIKSITELEKAHALYDRGTESCYVIITKEKARDGYMKRPSVIWSEKERAFLCPTCLKPVMMDVFDDGSKYEIAAGQFYFQKENTKNHKCRECGDVLWTELVPDRQSDWVKISNYGFIHRYQARDHYDNLRFKVTHAHSKSDDSIGVMDTESIKFPKAYYDIEAVMQEPEGTFHAAGAYNRFPLSTYIKRKMKGKVDSLIIDEIQDYNNDSGQGDAMCELYNCAKKVIGLTGTLINGYSQGIFYFLYRVAPHLMQLDNKAYTKTKDFNDEYGVTECVFENSGPEYNSNRRTIRKKVRERQLPGVSPLVYSRFLMDSTAFLSLQDMGKELPEYEEIPVGFEMDTVVKKEYKRIEDKFVDILKHDKAIASKVMSAFMSLLTVYPDQPYEMKPILNPLSGATLLEPKDTSNFDVLSQKDTWLLEKVKEKIASGERVIVYTSWVRIDTQEKLSKLFKENGIRSAVLTTSVSPNKREEWVEKRVKEGVQVLITNSSLVETGLDLNDFTTLIYYNVSYKLFTLRQSSRRSWRINQRAPRVEVYFLYFEGAMQQRALRLMASKLAVAGIIEGNFSDEGLAAMSECQDLTTILAQELTMGIKDEVEDLGAVFKKMALLKPEEETVMMPEIPRAIEEHVQPELFFEPIVATFASTESRAQTDTHKVTTVQTVSSAATVQTSKSSLEDSIVLSVFRAKPRKKKKAEYVAPGQISLFDFISA